MRVVVSSLESGLRTPERDRLFDTGVVSAWQPMGMGDNAEHAGCSLIVVVYVDQE